MTSPDHAIILQMLRRQEQASLENTTTVPPLPPSEQTYAFTDIPITAKVADILGIHIPEDFEPYEEIRIQTFWSRPGSSSPFTAVCNRVVCRHEHLTMVVSMLTEGKFKEFVPCYAEAK